MKKEPRWLKSVLAAANAPQVALPFARGNRRISAAMKPVEKPKAVAAH